MTAILCVGNTIAWESCITYDGIRHVASAPKVYAQGGSVWATSGNSYICEAAIKTLLEGRTLLEDDAFKSSEEDFEILRAMPLLLGGYSKRIYSSHAKLGYESETDIVYLGSGGKLAFGAYATGKIDVLTAIQIAAEHDLYSMGPCYSSTFDRLLAKPYAPKFILPDRPLLRRRKPKKESVKNDA